MRSVVAEGRGHREYRNPSIEEGAVDAWHEVMAAIRSEDVEDGRHHPAEPILGEFLRRFGDGGLVPLLKGVAAHPEDFAAALRLLGRTSLLGPGVRSHLVMRGLQSAVVDVRDAAMQAVESWGDPTLIPVLQRHVEPDKWLAEYQRRIIDDRVIP